MNKKNLPYGAIQQTADHFGVTRQTVQNAILGKTNSVQSRKIRQYIEENFKDGNDEQ